MIMRGLPFSNTRIIPQAMFLQGNHRIKFLIAISTEQFLVGLKVSWMDHFEVMVEFAETQFALASFYWTIQQIVMLENHVLF